MSVNYYIQDQKKFVIENYNWATPFADFFPGIAGVFGVPMWIYYVSRNQGIVSMGVGDKDNAILEFQSFNKALSLVGKEGFRTFLRVQREQEDVILYEPFQKTRNKNISQKMIVSSSELVIEEKNIELGLSFKVIYFPIVNDRVPALTRRLEITNLESSSCGIEVLDGLSHVVCKGMDRTTLHVTARHIEGMISVADVGGLPVFRLSQDPSDREVIEKIDGGNFYFSFLEQKQNVIKTKNYIIDPEVIFAEPSNYDYPWHFYEKGLSSILKKDQVTFNRTPSAFSAFESSLNSKETLVLTSVVGSIEKDEILQEYNEKLLQKSYLKEKRKDNFSLIEEIKNKVFTVSSSENFDEYMQQTFLDNVIRGGMPVGFETSQGQSSFYIYSRQNGDLERDYHNIILEPGYYSQGTGHYRSVLQNRRSDSWFFPNEVSDYNIFLFMNLIQTDGYNPIEVNQVSYLLEDQKKAIPLIKGLFKQGQDSKKIIFLLESGSFTPGQLAMALEDVGMKNQTSIEDIIRKVLVFCKEDDIGGVHEGYWVDHWFYNLDLIDNFLSIYPEKLKELFVGRNNYTFYDNVDIILPRRLKYVINGKKQVRQYGAVHRDQEKIEMLEKRKTEKAKVRTDNGNGKIYQTNLLTKLLVLVANRISNLDPSGIGLQMESDKPGWNDSTNGIPGLLGSSICETLQLLRACRFFATVLATLDENGVKSLMLYSELAQMVKKLQLAMKKRIEEKDKGRFSYWQSSSDIKESYREKTRMGILGTEQKVSITSLLDFIKSCILILDDATSKKNKGKLFDENGLIYTYFENRAVKFSAIKKRSKEIINQSGFPLADVQSFKQRPIKKFLEGPMHYLRAYPEKRKEIYLAIKNSKLYDKKLQMYKVCEPLADETFEIGRVHAWPQGWIENESIYAHMEYKYLLEILRSGLYNEFYQDIKTGLSCYLDPATYGRSIFENVSFYVSSAYKDESQHGRGFQARLSGVTSEMLSMWLIMTVGEHPFQHSNDKLTLKLDPKLSGSFFTEKEKVVDYFDGKVWKKISIGVDCFACKFLGQTLVVYKNKSRKDTFGKDRVTVRKHIVHFRNNKSQTIEGSYLAHGIAEAVRNGDVSRIDVELG